MEINKDKRHTYTSIELIFSSSTEFEPQLETQRELLEKYICEGICPTEIELIHFDHAFGLYLWYDQLEVLIATGSITEMILAMLLEHTTPQLVLYRETLICIREIVAKT